ncbi:MAG TPA: ABC transporter ATP-binding protein [Acidimicrobiales bacterium]|nr:ABC transporter ATP-binding protein [Acidimicrobiales bacterium]
MTVTDTARDVAELGTRSGASLELRGVSLAYPGPGGAPPAPVLQDVDLSLRPGERVALIGPSGCGKSTLLNMIGGLLEPDEGQVTYDGGPIAGVNTDVGYMTQRDTLLPYRTVEANVALPLKFRHERPDDIRRRVDETLEQVGLSGFGRAYPGQLSGGMRSRAMIARTLVYRPRTLLMDEPLAALDALLRQKMQSWLLEMWGRESMTVLYVTHEIEEALLLADRIVVFSRRPARVLLDLAVTAGKPRDTRRDPDLIALHDLVWETLRDQLEAPSDATAFQEHRGSWWSRLARRRHAG